MNLTVSPDKKSIKFGESKYRILPESGELYDHVCETYGDVKFDDIRSLRGQDFPPRVMMDFSSSNKSYGNASLVKITRHNDAVRISLDCSYYFDSWREPVHLVDFYNTLVEKLRELGNVVVDAEADFQKNFAFISIASDYPLQKELSEGQSELAATMRREHRKALNALIASTQELAFGGGAFKIKPYIGRWFEVDLPRILKKILKIIGLKA